MRPETTSSRKYWHIFWIELSLPTLDEIPEQWILSVDDSSNLYGSGVVIVLEGPGELVLEKSLWFSFQSNKNQAEYEAVISGLKLAKEVRVFHLLVQTDSQLVASQIKGDF